MSKGKIRLRYFISKILDTLQIGFVTYLAVVFIVGLNQGCGKPQEQSVEAPLHSQTESTSQPVAAKEPVTNDATGHFNMGVESAKKGNLDEAVTEWKKAVEMDPKFIKAHNYLARSYYTKERFDDALSEYKKIVELDPADAMAHASIGFVYRMKGMYDDAITACNKALQINPQLAAAYNCIGMSYVQKKMYEDAINAYKMALAINPNYADALFGLGIAYESQGNIEDAKQAFEAFDKIKEKGKAAKPAH